MTDDELREVIREAQAREARHPHHLVAESDRRARPASIECACGRVFTCTTWGRASASWSKHRQHEGGER